MNLEQCIAARLDRRRLVARPDASETSAYPDLGRARAFLVIRIAIVGQNLPHP